MGNAVILLSGGLDSVIATAGIINDYKNITAITFNYGQKAFEKEEKAAKEISEFYGINQKTIDLLWLKNFSSGLINGDLPHIKNLDNKEETEKSAKSVWVPNRNALFINIAACFAEAENASAIIIGANKEEAGTFKDNSKEFIESINNSLKNSTQNEVKVYAPLIGMTKSQIVETGIKLGVPFEKIYSCYAGYDKHCGKCESCLRLKRAFELNGRHDIIEKVFNGDI